MRRSNEEFMLLILSFGGSIVILPFSVLRLIDGEHLTGTVDLALVVGMATLGTFVYFKRYIQFAGLMLAIFVFTGMTALIYLRGPALIYWTYPALIGVYFILTPRLAMFLTLLVVVAIAPALFNHMDNIVFVTAIMTLVTNNVFVYVFAARTHKHARELSFLVRRDPLTGAGNRMALDEKLEEIIALSKRTQQPVSILLLDVDHFKNINDEYGHAIGDQVLVRLTDLIKLRIRASDSLYRFGGEEFVLVLVGARSQAANGVAEDLRLIIENAALIDDRNVTVSLGVAELKKDEPGKHWIDRCDKALYHAKETGRNRTCIAN